MRIRRAIAASVAAAAVLPVPAGAATGHYTVRWGDTLTWIARAHHIGLLRLARLNHIQPYGMLLAGTTLRVPAPHRRPRRAARHRPAARTRIVVVRPGQTLSGIAERAGTTAVELARINHRGLSAVLPVGTRLRLPARRPRPVSRRAGVIATLDHWAWRYRVDRRLVRAIAWQESGWRRGLVSRSGAWGVMQVMPGTWRYVERTLIRRRVARTFAGNVHVGVAYLAHLLHAFGGRVRLAVAGYYQGEVAVRLYGILPVSVGYVADVLALRRRM